MKEKSNATLRRAASLRCRTDAAIARLGRAVACYQRGAITTAELLREASAAADRACTLELSAAELAATGSFGRSVNRKVADYRNYMSYEILVTDDTIKEGKLSKTVGYNSGAGTQIPYTLILSAALSMLYNARVNSVRLLFIDEPFEKMSDHNIKLMLDFFQAQNFQVIFCAPPNRLESIGSECSVIIPLLKLKKEDMRIGKVKFHEQ